jgi:outer membrane protein
MRSAAFATLVVGLSLVAGATPLRAQQAEETALKVGVFDPQRVSEETEEGKKVQTDLTSLRDRKQAELLAKEKELTELQNQLTAQGLSLSPEKRTSLEKEIQKKALELQQARESARNEMQFELGAAQDRFRDRLLAVVERFGREEGFTLILDKSLTAYSTSAIDVTTAIVDRFNAVTKQAPAATPPAPAPPPKGGGGS